MLSKSQARAFFFGGTAVTFLIFIGLTVYSLSPSKDQTNHQKITAEVIRGKGSLKETHDTEVRG